MTRVRAMLTSVAMPAVAPPHNTMQMRLYYPAVTALDDTARATGQVAPDHSGAPCPIVVIMPGVNVDPQAYRWLATALVQHGLIAVTYSWVTEHLPGHIGISPGVDLAALTPDTFGSAPTCPVLSPLLAELARLNADGVLKGMLKLDAVVLGGHSAGGTMALLNAAQFDNVVAAWAYGAHTQASTMLGWPPNTLLPLTAAPPVLLLGGSADGVIAASATRYGDETPDSYDPIARTFREAVHGEGHRAVIAGATHFTIVHPFDPTLGRAFLETQPDDGLEDARRNLIAALIADFTLAAVATDTSISQRLAAHKSHPHCLALESRAAQFQEA